MRNERAPWQNLQKTHMSLHITISYTTLPAVAVLANPSSLDAENNTIFFFSLARHSINKNQSYFGRVIIVIVPWWWHRWRD